MAELLLELLSEEIPARMQRRAADDLKRLVTEKLTEVGLTYTKAEAFVTPRRLALVVDGLPTQTPDKVLERKGPRVSAPAKAIEGFLKAVGRSSLAECVNKDTGKGEFWFAQDLIAGRLTSRAIAEAVQEVVPRFPWPKSMRWADHRLTWVRPLRNILAVFDGEQVALDVELFPGDIEALRKGRSLWSNELKQTYGHRFLAPGEIAVADFADYKRKLRKAYVILDPAERRAVIRDQAAKLAAENGLIVKPDEQLLDEVVGLVEWPVVLMGRFDESFMDLPAEVLTTAMRHHQKYFALQDKDGRLAPRFLVVANMETADGGRTIVAGNERVLRARLADAKFFWDQDRKTKLEERVPALKDIVFHAKLGTMADKATRVQTLAAEIAAFVPGADVDRVRSAALLAKADLTTGMVGEFPELQGVVGRHYALAEGEKPEVADAIAEHYSPLGPNDRCPSAPVSVAVALADKIDTLVGFFAIDEKPTGSKDPFALRRAALGAIRLIVENRLRLPLGQVFRTSFTWFGFHLNSYDQPYVNLLVQRHLTIKQRQDENIEAKWEHGLAHQVIEMEAKRVSASLLDFFADRLEVALKEKGVRHDLIAAVFAQGGEDDLVRLLARVDALKSFLEGEDGANLLTASKRAVNIVRIEEKKDATTYGGAAQPALLRETEERTLAKALRAARRAAGRALGSEDFTGAMAALARLRHPVDEFFDRVTVNCGDAELRANRLRLLSQIRTTLATVADFSRIEG